MDKKVFFQMMDEVVLDENEPGSTPQDPKKRVRTMVINGKSGLLCLHGLYGDQICVSAFVQKRLQQPACDTL